MSNEQGIHTRVSYEISTGSVFLNLVQSLQSNIVHWKIFLSDWIQRSYCKILTPHYACRNADLNLILVVATTNAGFIFQLSESWGIRLTRLDCNWPCTFCHFLVTSKVPRFHLWWSKFKAIYCPLFKVFWSFTTSIVLTNC